MSQARLPDPMHRIPGTKLCINMAVLGRALGTGGNELQSSPVLENRGRAAHRKTGLKRQNRKCSSHLQNWWFSYFPKSWVWNVLYVAGRRGTHQWALTGWLPLTAVPFSSPDLVKTVQVQPCWVLRPYRNCHDEGGIQEGMRLKGDNHLFSEAVPLNSFLRLLHSCFSYFQWSPGGFVHWETWE